MTKSRFSIGANMRLSCTAALVLALGLGRCGTGPFGTATDGFDFPQIARAYIPLHTRDWTLSTHDGAAIVLAPGVAVTNAHNANLVDPAAVIGRSAKYDLLYFRTDRSSDLPTVPVVRGEQVIAYGQAGEGDLRVSRGAVSELWPGAFGFVSNAGPGFSGGPVLDANSGALLGITYGYEGEERAKSRLMVAYNMALVRAEFAALKTATSGAVSVRQR